MGTPTSVAAAVIYMASLEGPLLSTNNPFFYRRFIDNIFFIWTGTLSDLYSFLDNLNNLPPTIKLTRDISRKKVIFLDTVVYTDPLHPTRLLTRPFQKPLNRDICIYIPFTSCLDKFVKLSRNSTFHLFMYTLFLVATHTWDNVTTYLFL